MSHIDSVEIIKPLKNGLVAITGGINKSISVWSLPKLNFPTHTFRTDFKESILKIDADIDNRYLIAMSGERETFIKTFEFEENVEQYSSMTMAVTSDHNDSIFFSFYDKSGVIAKVDTSIKAASNSDSLTFKELPIMNKKISEPFSPRVSFNTSSGFSAKIKDFASQKLKPKNINELNIESLFKTNMLKSVEDQTKNSLRYKLIYFEEKYLKEDSNIDSMAEFNQEIAKKMNLNEIAETWKLLRIYYSELDSGSNDIEFVKREKAVSDSIPKVVPSESNKYLLDFLNFYSQESDNRFVSMDPQEIFFNEGKVFIHNNIELKMKAKKRKKSSLFTSENKVLFSKLAEEIITKLVDSGELIHAYAMYRVFKPALVSVKLETSENWELWYIRVLKDHEFYSQAAKLALNSESERVKKLMSEGRSFDVSCPGCGCLIVLSDKGKCSKCNKKISCGVCKKPVNGLIMTCTICGHGGHFKELMKYFNQENDVMCPEGCDHRCFLFN